MWVRDGRLWTLVDGFTVVGEAGTSDKVWFGAGIEESEGAEYALDGVAECGV